VLAILSSALSCWVRRRSPAGPLVHGRVSRTAPDSIETLFLEIAVRSCEAVEFKCRAAERTVAAECPPPTARLIEGAFRIVNAANAAHGGQISCAGASREDPFGLKIVARGAIAGI